MVTFAVDIMEIVFGLAGGIAVGCGLVAFLAVLGIIPRLAQVTKSYDAMHWYEGAIVCGSLYWTFADFFDWRLHLLDTALPAAGLMCGAFVGLLAAALTEVINVLPILAKRLQIRDSMRWLLAAMVAGKVLGSLFEWIIY